MWNTTNIKQFISPISVFDKGTRKNEPTTSDVTQVAEDDEVSRTSSVDTQGLIDDIDAYTKPGNLHSPLAFRESPERARFPTCSVSEMEMQRNTVVLSHPPPDPPEKIEGCDNEYHDSYVHYLKEYYRWFANVTSAHSYQPPASPKSFHSSQHGAYHKCYDLYLAVYGKWNAKTIKRGPSLWFPSRRMDGKRGGLLSPRSPVFHNPRSPEQRGEYRLHPY